MPDETLQMLTDSVDRLVTSHGFAEALVEWAAAIGPQNVLSEYDDLTEVRQATIPDPASCSAVLRPETSEHVQQIVRIANQFQIPLYPISQGKNWGYGDASPTTDNQVIVDMSQMNRVIEVNEDLAYAVIEPGVTQQQLFEYVDDKNIPLWIDPTGAGPNASLLGNALERGYGITPYGDHFATICGLDVVLPTGQMLKTGFGHFDNAKAHRLFPNGVGPALDGMFTQSNFGIVTRMGLWLMPRPEHFELCLFSIDDDQLLPQLIEKTRYLKLHRIVQGSINLVSRNRALTVIQQFPWDEMQSQTPMSDQVAQQIADQYGVGIWNGVCGLYGPKDLVRSQKKIIKQQLKPFCRRVSFISQSTVNTISRFPRIVSVSTGLNASALLSAIRPAFGLLSGIPNEAALNTAYWRKKIEVPTENLDPKRDGCGLIWYAPVLPMNHTSVEEFQRIAEPILHKFGFDFCMTLTTVTARAFDCTLPILFDRTNDEDVSRAKRCYEELLDTCANNGFFPYRVHSKSMSALQNRSKSYWEFCETIKNSIDPDGIISPGRYQPQSVDNV